MLTHRNKQDNIDSLILRYVSGDLSEPTFTASLRRYCDADEIRHILMLHQFAHRNSTAYRKGLIE